MRTGGLSVAVRQDVLLWPWERTGVLLPVCIGSQVKHCNANCSQTGETVIIQKIWSSIGNMPRRNIAQVAATNAAACLARPVKRALPVVLYLINKI